MSISTIELPVSKTGRHYTEKETAEIAELLVAGPVSDGVVYSEPRGKQSAQSVAQYQAFFLRQDLITDGHFEKATITSKTWEDEEAGGFRWAVLAVAAK